MFCTSKQHKITLFRSFWPFWVHFSYFIREFPWIFNVIHSNCIFCKEKRKVYLIFCQHFISEAFGLYLHQHLIVSSVNPTPYKFQISLFQGGGSRSSRMPKCFILFMSLIFSSFLKTSFKDISYNTDSKIQ